MNIVPIMVATAMFGVSGWVLNKILTKTTGRDLDENLDYAGGKILEFVRPTEVKDEDSSP